MAAAHPNNNVTILVVPGSFVTPPLYDGLIKTIRDQGYDAKAIELLSANDGTRLPAPTTADDAEHIRQDILSILDDPAEPKDVVLALHSYSGVPGSSAVKGLSKADRLSQGKKTSVISIAYMAAFLLPRGKSNRVFMDEHRATPEALPKNGLAGGYMPAMPAEFTPILFGDVDSAEEQQRLAGFLTAHSWDSFDGGATYEAWKDIPSITIIPEQDNIILTNLQEMMFEDAVAAGGKVTRVFVKGAGHVVPVSRPEVVAAELIKLAGLE